MVCSVKEEEGYGEGNFRKQYLGNLICKNRYICNIFGRIITYMLKYNASPLTPIFLSKELTEILLSLPSFLILT